LEFDRLELTISSVMVELRLPVVALVKFLVTGSVLCIHCGGRGHGSLESSSAHNSVHMAGSNSWADNGIGSLDCQWITADGEELSIRKLCDAQREGCEHDGSFGFYAYFISR
jgi:hypothetical protein